MGLSLDFESRRARATSGTRARGTGQPRRSRGSRFQKTGSAMKPARIIRLGFLVIGTCACLGIAAPTRADSPKDYFRENCSMCHSVGGGDLGGPDLKGVTTRKDRAWLVKFLQDPKAVIDSGDPYAARLLHDAQGLVMPEPSDMTPALANALLDYIEGERTPATSGTPAAARDEPFTPADAALGRELFLGERPFANGAPACVSCHTLETVGGLGGGRLGPDLTHVYDRLGGRKGVGAWLSSPPTPIMQSLFRRSALRPEEITPLLAIIDDAGRRAGPAGMSSMVTFVLLGVGGMAAGLALLQLVWRGRLRAVRRPMVRGQIPSEP